MLFRSFLDHCYISREIIKQCSNEQIAAAPPRLLELFAAGPDYEMLSTLVEKGISGGGSAARTLHMLTYEGRNSWIAEELLEKRMWVDPNDHGALYACMENGAELRWGPHKADLWLCGERRHSGMSEPRRKRRGEGYAACADAAKLLLDSGTNLDQYKEWAKRQSHGLRCDGTLVSLEEHWAKLQAQAQESAEQEQAHEGAGPKIGGMDLC